MTSETRPAAVTGGAAPLPDPPVSVVMAVRNEARHLPDALDRLLGQDYAGELEVVVAVGRSSDATERVARAYAVQDPRVRVLANPDPGGATPCGLNAAWRASRHDVVVRVDGHALVPPDYVATAVRTLERTGADNVGGVMAAEGRSAFEQAVARAMTSHLGVGSAAFHVGGEEGPADTVYLGAFRREALERVDGYDERMVRAQDWELNLRLRRTGGLVWFQPGMRVTYRPRSSVPALARQYLHYGRWRRVLVREHPDTLTVRYLAPPATVVCCAAGLLAALAGHRRALALPGGYTALVLVGGTAAGSGLPWRARAWLPVALAVMHLSWGVGFLTSRERLQDVGADPSADRLDA